MNIPAAHCILQKYATKKILPRDILAIFGAYDLSNSYEPGRIVQPPKKIFIHDDWNHMTSDYDADVSLLKFEDGGITFNSFVHPICLWNSENEPTVTEGMVTGWGKTERPSQIHENIPKRVKALIETNEQCFFNTKALLDLSSFRTFCAGLRNGSGVCFGDSGGGLFINVDDNYYLKGIVSSSLIKDGGCDISKNAVFTNVIKFIDWIKEIIESETAFSTRSAYFSTTTKGSVISSTASTEITTKMTTKIPRSSILTEVFCTFITMGFWKHTNLYTCVVNESINIETYELGSPFKTNVKQFYIFSNTEVKYLPGKIGEKFPNLKEFWVRHCGLIVLRSFYFKNMFNLEYLVLNHNNIAWIESVAFRDLVNVKFVNLAGNMIKKLNINLFITMKDLRWLYLNNNKIELLRSTTFTIPGGKLMHVNLTGNHCIDKDYSSATINQLKHDLKNKCGVIFL